jgi:hypothetical protein
MNVPFSTVSVGKWLCSIKLAKQPQEQVACFPGNSNRISDVRNIRQRTNWRQAEKEKQMMYMTLTLLAGLIGVMFVATAVSSIVNSVRESSAERLAQTRRVAF